MIPSFIESYRYDNTNNSDIPLPLPERTVVLLTLRMAIKSISNFIEFS
ncbi:hypothetical protein VCR31J2_1380056 [Vibrio coralliirubri]|uniref:Uncharacterized protein n=1 Tax=Vibrio coralliirubri TaxID=1516159 RepID=A0AA86WVR4_9VIBR|nr:hypothetical protein VCR31J2_1380056 [Vibrio coralliirubri]